MSSIEIDDPGAIYYLKQNSENGVLPMNTESAKAQTNKIQERMLQDHFLRMCCDRKMDLITKMFYETRNLNSLSSVLNTFFAVNTKLIFYTKITDNSNSLYEQFVRDHDRMLETVVLNESISEDIQWFRTLKDSEQIDVIISLLRLSGGNVIKKMYWRLIKIFNEKILNVRGDAKKYTSRTSMDFPEDVDRRIIAFNEYRPKYSGEIESDYNPDCQMHKKVIEGRRQWQAVMGKLRKDIEMEVQKLNEPILKKKSTTKPDSADKKSDKKSKRKSSQKSTSPRAKQEEIDWIQLLPVWTVKKIFSYLDKKVLQNLKLVNNYWSVISKEVMAEQKMRIQLDSTIKKSEEFLDHLLGTSEKDLVIDESAVVLENTSYRKRMEKQRRTGTSLKVFEQDSDNLHTKTLLPECFYLLETEFKPLLVNLRPFPVGVPVNLEYETDELSETESVSVPVKQMSETLAINDDVSLEVSKFVSVDPDKQNVFDNADTLSIGSLVPSILVTKENMDSW